MQKCSEAQVTCFPGEQGRASPQGSSPCPDTHCPRQARGPTWLQSWGAHGWSPDDPRCVDNEEGGSGRDPEGWCLWATRSKGRQAEGRGPAVGPSSWPGRSGPALGMRGRRLLRSPRVVPASLPSPGLQSWELRRTQEGTHTRATATCPWLTPSQPEGSPHADPCPGPTAPVRDAGQRVSREQRPKSNEFISGSSASCFHSGFYHFHPRSQNPSTGHTRGGCASGPHANTDGHKMTNPSGLPCLLEAELNRMRTTALLRPVCGTRSSPEPLSRECPCLPSAQ